MLRTVLSTGHKAYYSYIIDNNLLEPIVKLYISNGAKYNLINSAVIELFETMKKVPMSSFTLHIGFDIHYSRLGSQ